MDGPVDPGPKKIRPLAQFRGFRRVFEAQKRALRSYQPPAVGALYINGEYLGQGPLGPAQPFALAIHMISSPYPWNKNCIAVLAYDPSTGTFNTCRKTAGAVNPDRDRAGVT